MIASRSVMSARSKWVTCGIRVADSVMRSAMVRRRCESGARSTGPHCSKRGSGGGSSPMAASGFAGPAGAASRAAGCGRASAGAAGGWAPVAARTSASRMRPPGPLPRTARMSTPSSRASRRVAGVAATGPPAGAVSRTGEGAAGAVGAGGAGAGRAGALAGTGAPLSEKVTSTAPTFTVCPGVTWIFSTRPPIGDGISTCALSVSTSSRGASSRMTSPSRTSTATISASVRPSPRSGRVNWRDISVI